MVSSRLGVRVRGFYWLGFRVCFFRFARVGVMVWGSYGLDLRVTLGG